jgi:hypothetical protein
VGHRRRGIGYRPRRGWRRPRRRKIPPTHIAQNQANLTHAADVLQKTTYAAPYDGMITNLPVREGETVVIGHSEFARQHAHDDCRHVGHHR